MMNQDDHRVSTALVAAYALWTVVIALLVVGWVVYIVADLHQAGIMLGLTGCATSAAAATAHIKVYARGVCGVVRDSTELAQDIRRLHAL